MGAWSKEKVNPSNINNGNEYTTSDQLPIEELNSMVNSGLYSQEFAEHLTDTPDTSEASQIGTPSVSFVNNVVNGVAYKKFKFSNLKGVKGDTGAVVVSTTLIGQDANGGNIYRQTLDNGTTFDFVAPKGNSGADVYDLIIKTQADFNGLLASPTWFGASNVAFVGDGGTLIFTHSGNGINIPDNVKTIQGFNRAIISNTAFTESNDNQAELSTSRSTNDLIINDLEIRCSGDSNLACFKGIKSINRCKANMTPSATDGSRYGFISCKNLINCEAYCTSSMATAYYNCTNLIFCEATIDDARVGLGNVNAFSNCDDCFSCNCNITVSTGAYGKYCVGFRSSNRLINCRIFIYGTVSNQFTYGMYSCGYLSNCYVSVAQVHTSAYGFNDCSYINGCYSSVSNSSNKYYNCTKIDSNTCNN